MKFRPSYSSHFCLNTSQRRCPVAPEEAGESLLNVRAYMHYTQAAGLETLR